MKKMKSIPSMPATGKFILTGHKKHIGTFTSIRCECSGDKILGYCTDLQLHPYTYARESLLANYDNVKFYVEDEELEEFEARQLLSNVISAISEARIAIDYLGLAMDLSALQTAKEDLKTYIAVFDSLSATPNPEPAPDEPEVDDLKPMELAKRI